MERTKAERIDFASFNWLTIVKFMDVPGLSSDTRSLADVHSSVGTSQVSFWKRMFAFAGPAYLVSVGYMDPGNWATDLEGGARFGYRLLWVLVMSNAMAILLQTLSARLGIVSGRDLAQACRETYPRRVNLTLWALCEIAIAACDLAEVLGAAIGLNLLFHIPLLAGVLLTAADTLLLLWFQSFGIRTLEAFVLALITVIAACFCIEIIWARPSVSEMVTGLVPRLDRNSLYVAIGHPGSDRDAAQPVPALRAGADPQDRPHDRRKAGGLPLQPDRFGGGAQRRPAGERGHPDLAAAVFFKRGIVVTEIQQAHYLLVPLLGTSMAGVMFAVALLCSGQSSTLTGTLAGQIVMEGFLNFRMRPWLRRLITRSLAIIPAALTIYFAGEKSTFGLLLLSQVILSMQLPFAIVPVDPLHQRSRPNGFVPQLQVGSGSGLDGRRHYHRSQLLAGLAGDRRVGRCRRTLGTAGLDCGRAGGPVPAGIAVLDHVRTVVSTGRARRGRAPVELPETAGASAAEAPVYHRILVPLDHTDLDRLAVSHAAAMARLYSAQLFLLHVEEGVTSQIYGPEASTAEVEAGEEYLERIAQSLRDQGIGGRDVDLALGLPDARDRPLRQGDPARPGDHGSPRPRRPEGPHLRQHDQSRPPPPRAAHADRSPGKSLRVGTRRPNTVSEKHSRGPERQHKYPVSNEIYWQANCSFRLRA